MRIILSPAKRMKEDTDSLPYRTLPAFLPMTEQLLGRLQGMSDKELKQLWNCNDQIAAINIERLRLTPYRLEMGAKLSVGKAKNLYEYWDNALAEKLFQETDCVIDLASREYSRCIFAHLRPEIRFLTCVFGERKNGKVVEKGTLCKMARGEMVRWMAREQVENIEKLKSFTGLGYQFCEPESSENTWVFLKE